MEEIVREVTTSIDNISCFSCARRYTGTVNITSLNSHDPLRYVKVMQAFHHYGTIPAQTYLPI